MTASKAINMHTAIAGVIIVYGRSTVGPGAFFDSGRARLRDEDP